MQYKIKLFDLNSTFEFDYSKDLVKVYQIKPDYKLTNDCVRKDNAIAEKPKKQEPIVRSIVYDCTAPGWANFKSGKWKINFSKNKASLMATI